METTMSALVLRGNKAVTEERPIPRAAHGEVVIKTTAASICSAEVACVTREFDATDGIILGHEAVGTIHEIGDGVIGFQAGQRVTFASTTPCGVCAYCQRGLGGHCRGVEWGGYKFGVSRDGTLAEYFSVPDANYSLAVVPDEVSDAEALAIVDTLSTGTTGAEAPHFPLGSTVVVIGQGHIGLGATMGARLLGAGSIVAVKGRTGHEELSHLAGANYVFSLADHDVHAEILSLTNGEGADCIIEASGHIDAFALAIKSTRLGGSISVLSTYHGPAGTTLPIDISDFAYGVSDKTIYSMFQKCGSERVNRLLALFRHNRLDVDFLYTRHYSWSQINDAFDDMASKIAGHIKPLITF
jgi:threonine dehydrogenase-like Zn-dependent dehydrogenase